MKNTATSALFSRSIAGLSVLALLSLATIAPVLATALIATGLGAALVVLTVNSYGETTPRYSTVALAARTERHPLAA